MSLSTIIGHLQKAKKDLCFRSFSNLRNQRVSVIELRQECQRRGWYCIEQSDGVLVAKSDAARLTVLLEDSRSLPNYDPNELPEAPLVPEGAKQTVVVNRYERDSAARARCIRHWGLDCTVCGFNFERGFGERGVGFIHVHHLKPLGEVKAEYQLDPINDLRPVCPNCHAMLHASTPAVSIEELKRIKRARDG